MASGSGNRKKSSSGRRKTSSTRNSTRSSAGRKSTPTSRARSSSKRNKHNNDLIDEIIIIVIIALAIILFLSNLGVVGSLGRIISGINYGTFGYMSYVIPLLMCLCSFFYFSNKNYSIGRVKVWSGIVLGLVMCSFAHIFSFPDDVEVSSSLDYYNKCSELKVGGGLIGGAICSLLEKGIGTVGTVIILIVLGIVALILFTEKSFFMSIESGGKTLYDNARSDINRRRERREEERPIREEEIRLRKEAKEYKRELLEQERLEKSARREERNRLKDEERLNKRRENTKRLQEENERRKEALNSEQQLRMDRVVSGVSMNTKLVDSSNDVNMSNSIATENADYSVNMNATALNGFDYANDNTSADNRDNYSDYYKPVQDDIHEIIPEYQDNQNNFYNYDSNSDSSTGFKEISFAKNPGDGQFEYNKVRNAHSISVNTNGLRVSEVPLSSNSNNYDDYLVKDVSNYIDNNSEEAEYEAAILRETSRLNKENEFDPIVKNIYEDYETSNYNSYGDETENIKNDLETNNLRNISDVNHHNDNDSINDNDFAEYESYEDIIPSYENKTTTVDEYKIPAVSVENSQPQESRKNNISSPIKAKKEFRFPSVNLLVKGSNKNLGDSKRLLDEKAERLRKTLEEFGVKVTMEGYTQGPAITRFEMKPDVGVKVSKVLSLNDDIMLSMAAKNVRIEAPIPGKALIGIELPNEENAAVMFRDLIESSEFKNAESKLSFAVGKGLSGETVVADIGKMPHMLIAGATGSGKSVCINTLIMSILYKARPDEVKLIMIDPKVVELSVYNGIPHLMIPVVTDPKQAAEALKWGVVEMDDRYNKFAEFGVRDLNGYNKKVRSLASVPDGDKYKVLPRIIIIVDELADLMMVASKEVEESICRIAQKARAAGIHLVIATQRPSVDVVTGLIKANMPSRIAFSVSSGTDSRTILDMVGAEKLLGKGDMLFYPQGYTKPARVQGAFISDQEVNDVVDFLKEHSGNETYNEDVVAKIKNAGTSSDASGSAGVSSSNANDELFVEAAKAIIDKNKASIGMLQRLFKIGFNRAARIMDQLADAGVVGEEEGTKPRRVLMSMEQLEQYIEDYL